MIIFLMLRTTNIAENHIILGIVCIRKIAFIRSYILAPILQSIHFKMILSVIFEEM